MVKEETADKIKIELKKSITKCNELENENKELKKEIKSWKKYSDEQEENIIEKNNIICNLEFQIEKLQKENEELKEYKKIAELTKISCCTAQNCEALNNAIRERLENQKLKNT